MNYKPYEPIEFPRMRGRINRDKLSIKEFWESFENIKDGISNSVGCYIFSLRAGKGMLPWYVGMAEKQYFKNECLTAHKILLFNDCLGKRKGTPFLTLIPKYTKTGRYAKKSKNGHRDIQFLETLLIASCLKRNPKLLNVKATKMLREIKVPGFINSGKGRQDENIKNFKNLIGS